MRLDFKRALGVAAVAHLVAMGALGLWRRAHRPAAPPGAVQGPIVDETEVALEPPGLSAPTPAEALPQPTALTSVVKPALASRDVPAPRAPLEPAPAGDSDPAPAPATPAEGWTLSPLRSTTAPELGLAGSDRNAMGQAARHAAYAEASRARLDDAPGATSVTSALDAHDHDLGLGPGGPLVRLARDAVRESTTPNVGHALFELRTDGAGIVLSVRVVDATSDRRSWDDVAAKLADSARAHPLKVPPGARGVAVTLRVDSAVRTKSGHDAGETRVTLMGIPLKKSNAPHPVDVNIALPVASLNVDPTDLLLDATTKPERVVNAWIVAEERL